MQPVPPYSSDLSSKSSLLTETRVVMKELASGASPEAIRERILDHNLLLKRTLSTRRRVWETIQARYLSGRDPELVRNLARFVTSPLPETARNLVLFYELARALPLVYDLTVDMLYGMYEQGRLGVSTEDVLAWLDRAEAAGHDEIAGWSPQTRGKVASNYLTVARDFGLLEGRQRKTFARLYVPLPAFLYVVYRLKDEGRPVKAIVEADDYRLFLMDDRDVSLLFEEATRAGYLTLQRAGDIYDLTFHYGSLPEVCDELVRQV